MPRSKEAAWGVLLASTAVTADTYSENMINDGAYKGVIIRFTITVGTASIVPIIQYFSPSAGTWETYLTTTTMPTLTTGEADIVIYPLGAGNSTGSNWSIALTGRTLVEAPIPSMWRLMLDVATGCTLSVGYQYLV